MIDNILEFVFTTCAVVLAVGAPLAMAWTVYQIVIWVGAGRP